MPRYTYLDTKTNTKHDVSLSISEWDELLETNPHYQWVPSTGLPTLDPVRLGRTKPDNAFTDKLKEMKRANPRSTMNTWNRGDI